MMTQIQTQTPWKERWDNVQNLADVVVIMQGALAAPRDEALRFLGALYEEFRGPDPVGGAAGTLEAMRLVFHSFQPSEPELRAAGVDPAALRSYLNH